MSRQLSTPSRPVVVVSATSLTDIADAYLVDHTVVDRVVVVAALGNYAAPNGIMAGPNGDMDPWADWIVAQRFRYIQVSGYYDQTGDVTAADVPNLPKNTLGARMALVQPMIISQATASDQVALLAVALPEFVVAAHRVSPDTSATFDSTQGPTLLPDASGNDWLVTQVAGSLPAPPLADAVGSAHVQPLMHRREPSPVGLSTRPSLREQAPSDPIGDGNASQTRFFVHNDGRRTVPPDGHGHLVSGFRRARVRVD